MKNLKLLPLPVLLIEKASAKDSYHAILNNPENYKIGLSNTADIEVDLDFHPINATLKAFEHFIDGFFGAKQSGNTFLRSITLRVRERYDAIY